MLRGDLDGFIEVCAFENVVSDDCFRRFGEGALVGDKGPVPHSNGGRVVDRSQTVAIDPHSARIDFVAPLFDPVVFLGVGFTVRVRCDEHHKAHVSSFR